jgi:hypothetical protein
MRPCNVSDPAQRWTFASDGAVSPQSNAEHCLTRSSPTPALPLSMQKCRGSAGRLDPVQQWRLNATLRTITTGDGHGCLCSTENPKTHPGRIHCRYPCTDSTSPEVTSNEVFAHDEKTGWVWSACDGPNCPNNRPSAAAAEKYCMTAASAQAAAPAPAPLSLDELAAHPATRPEDHPNCIPWSIDPQNTKPGWYHDAGMDGMILTANDTLISIHEAEKFTHQVRSSRTALSSLVSF